MNGCHARARTSRASSCLLSRRSVNSAVDVLGALAQRSDTTLLCDGLIESRDLTSRLFVPVSYLLSHPSRRPLLSRVVELGRGVARRGTVQCGVSRYVLSLNYSVGHILSRLPCCWVLFTSAARLVVVSDGHNWLIAPAQRYPGAYKHKHCLCSHTRSERHMSTRTVERPWALTRTFGCIAARTHARRIWL